MKGDEGTWEEVGQWVLWIWTRFEPVSIATVAGVSASF